MRSAGHVAPIGETRNVYKIAVEECMEKSPLDRDGMWTGFNKTRI
jgi:hypothetical protein